MATSFDNPFATRWTSPGAIDFIFAESGAGEPLIERFGQLGGRAVILGPHGCGKSTLLATLKPRFENAGRNVVPVVLHAGQHNIPQDVFHRVAQSEKGILIMDGWEQLRPWTQWHVVRRSKRMDFGLLVSAHALPRYRIRPQFPILIQIEPDLAVVQKVVARLITQHGLVVPETVLSASFDRCRGNVREILFDLYLWYERNHR